MKDKPHFYWKAYCNKERHVAIHQIENIVNQYGFITDFHMFSDMEINLKIEIAENKIVRLYEALNEYMETGKYTDNGTQSTTERLIMLNITFTRSTGNLKIEIPNVPG